MATSSKFDIPSGSPDRPLYTSGQRGSHIAAALDRSVSFRESMENPILSALPNMSRSSSTVTQGDVVNFFQCIRFDPKVLAADHKSSRQVDFKRQVSLALSISPDDSSSGSSKGKLLPSPIPEEVKRVKAGLRESFVKARERVKIFNDTLSVFNKIFPTVPSKKRSRSEGFFSDRSSVLSSDRSVLGPSVAKVGNQSHAAPSGFELEQQKAEERTKNAVPNKRPRTSLVEVRSNTLVRPSGTVDRDREMLRLPNGAAVQAEDRTLPLGGDGWEKSKMKKKRSGIKPDVPLNTMSTKPIDGYREAKQGMQQRPVADTRSRLSNDSHGFRPGVLNGAVGVGKSDGILQQTGLGMRSSIPRTDPDFGSLTNDRRDRPIGSDKERLNLRAVNKTNVRDDFNSVSPTSNTKMNASIRAPRSSSGVAPKLSPVVHRATVPNDWELSNCSNKPPAAVGANNRKRMASARSSSPPGAHGASQRPQKISRTARRTNLAVPIVSSNDEIPALDTGPDVSGNDIGLGFVRRLPGSSPQQVKLRSDPLSSATLSESEESGAVETKSRDKCRKSDEIDEKGGQNVQKVSTLVLSSRKNKPVTGEDLGDGVRRQGRTGRGFTSTRSLMPMRVEKVGNVGTAKQLRSARLGFDKSESKAGRPPTRKLSDRKAYPRQKHTATNTAADFLVGSDDGHEELLAAANAVTNHARAFANPFWKQMEPFFGFISDADISFLKKQGNLDSAATRTPLHSNLVGCSPVPNGHGLIEHEIDMGLPRCTELLAEDLVPGTGDHSVIPLCQRLIAALISEEDCNSGHENLKYDEYGTEFELDGELESNSLNDQSLLGFQFVGSTAFNGYTITGKVEPDEHESNIMGTINAGMHSSVGHSLNGLHLDQSMIPSMACSETQYDNMQINEKLLLEVRSIGIFPEPVPDMALMEDVGICDEISILEEKYQGQMSKKKGVLERLLNSASTIKDHQEKEFEERALDKLVGMACEKYMTYRGPHGTGGKSYSNKMAKQAALAFVKRTLEHCHKFENTGKSCFSEPLFKDIFISGSSNLNGARPADTSTEGEPTKPYASIRSLEGSMGSQQSPSQFVQNADNHDINSVDVLLPVNHLSEQTTGKEDTWSNRVKKRELLLDDVGGTIVTSSTPSGIGNSLLSSAKGKRSERDRDGKGHGREMSSRNGTTKIGRALSNTKGERKSKTKPKQKMTQLSVSVNGLVSKIPEQSKPALPSVSKSNEITTSSNVKGKDGFGLNGMDDPESLDLSNLRIPEMDVLGVPDDLDEQGQDLGSWLNIDDEGLQDHDFMGLEIPMDDLSDLNMMV
ncbi:hypothetical protein I3843_03G200500 [Carya illinoinensis]|uniref:Uncharacterized protein n=2 Tax=Carya illinoinensis TaxID=32201 RepID=A0A8T1R652_CARIL|nr:uncharacterized protein LOC122304324 isoform X2 [Carya illinoinensis]KAG2718054.1 hypothetical protein I3760_03G203100 [Carya illinoinensis]KAG2718055.1 hypothetical protein I3760_03G203100 [Carya illinoinensis]KAG6661964.1 hypothetical protein CIPAW_03G211600 [Carya illinoinensis]KAG6723270.1 hypothetical protein I3842_03G200400 [Carya illinoinensis]KAG6723271.1 hypothetical protein I3842_03G200400 [Carya illinoinensis]